MSVCLLCMCLHKRREVLVVRQETSWMYAHQEFSSSSPSPVSLPLRRPDPADSDDEGPGQSCAVSSSWGPDTRVSRRPLLRTGRGGYAHRGAGRGVAKCAVVCMSKKRRQVCTLLQAAIIA